MILLTYFLAILIAIEWHHVIGQTNQIEFTYTLDQGYPIGEKLFGNIAGVDVDKNNNDVIIFHRGSHLWNTSTFDANNIYMPDRNAPIPEETVIFIDPTEKRIIRAWGKDLFFMPHGLSLDMEGKHLWLTDVALHQVFKYTLDGSKEIIELGTPFVPGNDETHFCKPTSVADTGDYIFVADGYCNSRIVMFSASGKYLGEFGQSPDAALFSNSISSQPTFSIPHKITYAREAKMLCVADREKGRIQCFSFEPKRPALGHNTEPSLLLNGAIAPKFQIADPLFNGRLFSIDYSPVKGGILIAVSGASLFGSQQPPLGFVYNVTTGQLISRFAPPTGREFGMAHDIAITDEEAKSFYVVDISPVNLWKFSRPLARHKDFSAGQIPGLAGEQISRALSMIKSKEQGLGVLSYLIIFSIVGVLLVVITKSKRTGRHSSASPLYSNGYPSSVNSLFGNNGGFPRLSSQNPNRLASTLFSRRAFFSLFDNNRRQPNEFSRIPLEESDNSDGEKSDSDVEEFNINHASPNVRIDV